MMDLRIAEFADLEDIVAIYNATIASRIVTADTEPVSVASRHAWFLAHDPQRRPIWVLVEAGMVVAWLSLSDFYGRPAYQRTAELSVYVQESWRGKGLAHQLLAHALEQGNGLGIDTFLGFIFAANLPSLRLFESFAFQRWGHLPAVAELDGTSQDLIIVGRKL